MGSWNKEPRIDLPFSFFSNLIIAHLAKAENQECERMRFYSLITSLSEARLKICERDISSRSSHKQPAKQSEQEPAHGGPSKRGSYRYSIPEGR